MDNINLVQNLFSTYSYFKDFNDNKINNKAMDTNIIDDVSAKLKLLTMISKGDKINVKNFGVQTDNIFTRINRSFINIDSRNNCLQFVKTTINKAFQILSFYLSSDSISDKILCSNILQDIVNSKQGIENLCSTYKEDLMIVCNFATVIQNIDSKLAGIKSSHPHLFKDIENYEAKSQDNLPKMLLQTSPYTTPVTNSINPPPQMPSPFSLSSTTTSSSSSSSSSDYSHQQPSSPIRHKKK